MPNIFDGITGSASWLDDFLNSQAATDTKIESIAHWEEDVIKAVKARHYLGLDEALADLKTRTGLTETAMTDLTDGIMKRVSMDKEWHQIHGTSTPQLVVLANTKQDLIELANTFDLHGELKIANAIDLALDQLPKA